MKRKLIFLLFMMVTAQAYLPLAAQPLQFKTTRYDESNGLSSRVIRCLLQDSRGFIWLGTLDGLNRFDGYNFTIFRKKQADSNSLAGNNISRLAEDKDHMLWVGLNRGGLCRYDASTGRFSNYPLPPDSAGVPIADPLTMIYAGDHNQVWAGIANHGLARLDTKTGKYSFYNIPTPDHSPYTTDWARLYNHVYAAEAAGNDSLWLATHNGLYLFNKKTGVMAPIRETSSFKNNVRTDLFTSMYKEKNDLWMSSWSGGLACYHIISGTWEHFLPNPLNAGLSTTNIINDVQPADSNHLWVSSADKGLGQFDKKKKTFNFPGTDSLQVVGLPTKFSYNILKDSEGNLWESYDKGLLKVRLQESNFIFHETPVAKSYNDQYYPVTKIVEDGTYIFTGTALADGLHVFNKKTGSRKTFSFDMQKGEEQFLVINDIIRDKTGNVWILTRDFLYLYDTVKQRMQKQPVPPVYRAEKPSPLLYRMAAGNDGNLWIATRRNGLLCFSAARKKYTSFTSSAAPEQYIPFNALNALAIDGKGRIWIGSSGGGLGYYDTAAKRYINLPLNPKQKNALPSNRIHSLLADSKADMWVGTDLGLCHFNCSASGPELQELYTSEQGLRADLAIDICEDSAHHIWCITPAGLCVVDPAVKTVKIYTTADGLFAADAAERLMNGATGEMRMSAWRGYFSFFPSLLKTQKIDAPLVMISFAVNGTERFYENELKQSGSIKLLSNENIFSFEFAALDYANEKNQQYAYQLEGFDKDWVYSGNRRYANYTNIQGGDYTFKVKATNLDQNWGGAVLSIPVHVNKPFYKIWWIIALTMLFVAAGIYAFFWSRLRKQRQIMALRGKAQLLEKEKAMVMYESLKQQLNPHFLFNSLTSLSSLIQSDQKTAKIFLDQMSKIYRYILKNRGNDLILLGEEIKFVQTYIKLQQTRFEEGLIVHTSVDEACYNKKIVPVTLQNLIENAIKHNIIDTDSPLTIDIFTRENNLVVRNNLQLKKFVETSNKQGMVNLQSLYQYLGNRLVTMQEDQDYFTVTIPLL